jgi:NADH:ubiquinone reductase (H+-translocating)
MFRASNANKRENQNPPKVVILGGGYGGVHAALKLEKAARRGQIDLSLVSRDNYFLQKPLMAEALSGSIQPLHIVNPIRRVARFTNFYKAEVEAIDAEAHQVTLRYPGHTHYHYLPYDYLVIALGSSSDLSRLPGMAEHAFPFQTLGDAFFLRNHLISVIEMAEIEPDPEAKRELLTFVVVGGGYTGVEVVAEINDFVKEAARSYLHVDASEVRVILLHSGDRILPELDKGLAHFGHRILERKGIEVWLNSRIIGATAQSAILNDGTTIPARTLVAAIGSSPNRVLDSLPCPRERGRLLTDETLAVPGCPGVWVVGDCAAIPDIVHGGTNPPTAQYALREAKDVARNIMAVINGSKPKPFSHKNLGVFVPLGRFSAAAEIMRLKLSGFPAWWLYRTYYLSQIPGIERKLRVVLDWTLELFFHRDIVQLDVIRTEGITRAHYEAGAIIFQEGELARNFYIILSGEVQVFRQQNGTETPVATLGAGEYFGEMSLLREMKHTASVRSLTPLNLLVMNGGDFTALASSSTRLGKFLESVIEQRLSPIDGSETWLE